MLSRDRIYIEAHDLAPYCGNPVDNWMDGHVAVCGPLIGAAKQFAACQGFEVDPPRGVTALRALVAAIRAHGVEPELDDGGFVEGAGAFLGMVLIDQLGDACHESRAGVHRVRCGAHGFVDPFRSVTSALEASDAGQALVRAVAEAEAEAAGQGPMARVVGEVRRQLAELSDEACVGSHFDRRLSIQVQDAACELNLDRILQLADGEPRHVLRTAVRHLLSTVPLLGDDFALDWEQAREQVIPRLVGDRFVGRLPSRQARESLLLTPIVGELHVALLMRFERGARFVTRREAHAWSTPDSELLCTAVNNLAEQSAKARLLHTDTDSGPMVVARSGDGLDAARLLLPGLHEVLARELGSPFVAVVPHRDGLSACPRDAPGVLRHMLQTARDEALRAAHAISDQGYLVHADGRITALALDQGVA